MSLLALAMSGCSAAPDGKSARGEVTVTNCGEPVTLPAPAQRLFVNDSNLISMILALGAEDQVAAVSSLNRDEQVLAAHYGPAVGQLNQVSDDYPSLETVVAQRPDVMVAGWNYGYDEAKHLTPDSLAAHDIGAYVLTESCRQDGGDARGIVDPWTALRQDLTNLGTITGRASEASEVTADLAARLDALSAAPQADEDEAPVLFVFDSGEKTIFTSGAFGAPQAIIEAAGGRNAVGDLKDTWTEVSWERLATARPDAFLFVDYPGQTYRNKVEILRSHPATRDLDAVRQERFLNLPYAMWTSGPLNIDAAEQVRAALEQWRLVPSR
ncbi:ABC transporter substrate-binding protein [Nocardioides sp.]|nr:ABC transporter substrate-binding protein [Nocardioides sp.]